MRKSLLILIVAALCVGCLGSVLSEGEITGKGVYVSPNLVQGTFCLEEPGVYVVSDDCIPSGVYELTTDGFEGKVYLATGNLLTVSKASSVSLRPVIDLDAVGFNQFTAYEGSYTVGVDFPAGKYVLKSVDSISFVYLYEYSMNPVFGDPDWSFPESEVLTIKRDENGLFCDLKDGNWLKISGSVKFIPTANGILFE